MNQTDPLHALRLQLEAFHISNRLQALANNDHLVKPKVEVTGKPELSISLSSLPISQTPSSYGLPSPHSGQRPCWEPPSLNYSWLETLIEAQKEMNTRDGHQDIAFRTDVMDNIVEGELLYNAYIPWVKAQQEMAYGFQSGKETAFWECLTGEIEEDMREVRHESRDIRTKHGKGREDCAEFRNRVVEIAREKKSDFLENRPMLGFW